MVFARQWQPDVRFYTDHCSCFIAGFRRRDVVARPTLTSQTQQLGHVMRDGARCAAHARKLSFLHRGANIGAVQTTWKEFAT